MFSAFLIRFYSNTLSNTQLDSQWRRRRQARNWTNCLVSVCVSSVCAPKSCTFIYETYEENKKSQDYQESEERKRHFHMRVQPYTKCINKSINTINSQSVRWTQSSFVGIISFGVCLFFCVFLSLLPSRILLDFDFFSFSLVFGSSFTELCYCLSHTLFSSFFSSILNFVCFNVFNWKVLSHFI